MYFEIDFLQCDGQILQSGECIGHNSWAQKYVYTL